MSEELKPCPACGSCVLKVNHYTCIVECQSCGLRGPFDRESPEKVWNALPRKLRWTRERPTKEGWYWYKHDDGQRIIGRLFHGGLHFPGGNFNSLKDMPGEWAGPIPEPEV